METRTEIRNSLTFEFSYFRAVTRTSSASAAARVSPFTFIQKLHNLPPAEMASTSCSAMMGSMTGLARFTPVSGLKQPSARLVARSVRPSTLVVAAAVTSQAPVCFHPLRMHLIGIRALYVA